MAKSTIKTYLAIISPLLKFKNTSNSIKLSEEYGEILMSLNESIQKTTQLQLTNDKLKDSWVDFNEIVDKYDEYVENVGNYGLSIDNMDKNNNAFIALSFLLLFVPRRVCSLAYMKIGFVDELTNIDDIYNEDVMDFNYILLNVEESSAKLVMKNYKTNKIYGIQEFTLSNRLFKLLYSFISTRKRPLKDNEEQFQFLLEKRVGNSLSNLPYTSSAISLLIKTFLSTELDVKGISSKDLRTIYVSTFYNTGKRKYITDIQQEAYKLGHSVNEFNNSYVKKDI